MLINMILFKQFIYKNDVKILEFFPVKLFQTRTEIYSVNKNK
jgi:hypothetical protein